MSDRPVFRYEDKTQYLDIAGYSKTNGDTIGVFTNGHPHNRTAYLVDTVGHDSVYGNAAREFFEFAKEKGWGKSEDHFKDANFLYNMFPKLDEAPWTPFSCSLLHLDSSNVSVINYGLPRPIKITKSHINEIVTTGSFFDFFKKVSGKPENISLQVGESIFFSTDGVIDNLFLNLDENAQKENDVYSFLENTLYKNRNCTAKEQVDNLIAELGNHILPKNSKCDDVSFMFIKRHH